MGLPSWQFRTERGEIILVPDYPNTILAGLIKTLYLGLVVIGRLGWLAKVYVGPYEL